MSYRLKASYNRSIDGVEVGGRLRDKRLRGNIMHIPSSYGYINANDMTIDLDRFNSFIGTSSGYRNPHGSSEIFSPAVFIQGTVLDFAQPDMHRINSTIDLDVNGMFGPWNYGHGLANFAFDRNNNIVGSFFCSFTLRVQPQGGQISVEMDLELGLWTSPGVTAPPLLRNYFTGQAVGGTRAGVANIRFNTVPTAGSVNLFAMANYVNGTFSIVSPLIQGTPVINRLGLNVGSFGLAENSIVTPRIAQGALFSGPQVAAQFKSISELGFSTLPVQSANAVRLNRILIDYQWGKTGWRIGSIG